MLRIRVLLGLLTRTNINSQMNVLRFYMRLFAIITSKFRPIIFIIFMSYLQSKPHFVCGKIFNYFYIIYKMLHAHECTQNLVIKL